MEKINFECECGFKIPMRIKDFPLRCKCGKTHYHESQIENNTGQDDLITEILAQPVSITHTTLDDVTACITTFMRKSSLERLINSIKKYYPNLKIDIQDTKGNLSWGRNELVKRCKTKYCLILEDDFEFTNDTKIESLLNIIHKDKELICIGGNINDRNNPRKWLGCDMRLFNNVLEFWYPPACQWKYIHNLRYRYCDMISNFFLASTKLLKQNLWDEELALMEHAPWFWEIRNKAKHRVGFTDTLSILHHKDRSDPLYKRKREDLKLYNDIAYKKYHFRTTKFMSNNINNKYIVNSNKNIVILNFNGGGSLLTQALHILGWNIGKCNQYYENIDLVHLNKRILCEMGVRHCITQQELHKSKDILNVALCDKCGGVDDNVDTIVHRVMKNIPSPWVIQDPRMLLAMNDYRWKNFFRLVQPTLLLVEDDNTLQYSKYNEKCKKMFCLGLNSSIIKARLEYKSWPYNKLFIPYDKILEVFKAIDFTRGF